VSDASTDGTGSSLETEPVRPDISGAEEVSAFSRSRLTDSEVISSIGIPVPSRLVSPSVTPLVV
jgi:hypothetical protein